MMRYISAILVIALIASTTGVAAPTEEPTPSEQEIDCPEPEPLDDENGITDYSKCLSEEIRREIDDRIQHKAKEIRHQFRKDIERDLQTLQNLIESFQDLLPIHS